MPKLLIKVILAVGLIGGGIYVATHRSVSSSLASQLQNSTKNMPGAVQGISENISTQTKQLSERTQEVSKHVQNVLGAYVQTNTDGSSTDTAKNDSSNQSKTSIPEATFEYGRYVYCQQVVKDYESTKKN